MLLDLSRGAAVALAFALCGCGSAYQYFGDTDPSLEQARYAYVKYHPGEDFNNEILAGRVRPGMSRDEVRASWGMPDDIGSGATHSAVEAWMYLDPEPSRGNQVYILNFDVEQLTKVEVMRSSMQGRTNAPRTPPEEIAEPEQAAKQSSP